MSKIKICGLMWEEDIVAANAALPDYAGFVFVTKSRRNVSLEQAAMLQAKLSPQIKAVGVFADEEPERVVQAAEQGVINMIQLHGAESERYIEALRRRVRLPIIKAFPVRNASDILEANRSCADLILLDTFRQGNFGGSGETFSWELLSGVRRPFFLAGGIGLSNLQDALATGAYGIDVSSGVEGADGKKDAEKMKQIVAGVCAVEIKGGNKNGERPVW